MGAEELEDADVFTRDTAVPTVGQLVTVRNRQWVATAVERSSISVEQPGSPLLAEAQHLVSLVSVDGDAGDEELRVLWELEPGAVAREQHALPSPAAGFDDPGELDAFLDAVRWGSVATADKTLLQAPFRSGVKPEDYQLDPVVRALQMPRTNLLIADDVGLGKTIEAGLVMQELMLRHRARTMLIVCPASLTLQWRDEMRDKFGLAFKIVDAELLKELRRSRGLYANPWTHYPRLIVSIDWLKRERPMALLRSILPPVPQYPRTFDLLVVDEVHTCAPSGSGKYAVDSQRTNAIKTLAPHTEHRLFLSATPHNGYLESFTALLALLDSHRFARTLKPSEEAKAQVMVRRLKRDLPPSWDGSPRFPERDLDHPLEVAYDAATRDAYAKLDEYAQSRREAISGQLTLIGTAPGRAADFVTTLLKRRFLSSPKAFANTVETHLQTMLARERQGDRARHDEQGAYSALEKILARMIEQVEETAEDDTAFEEAARDALASVRRLAPPLSPAEKALLEELRDWGLSNSDKADSKFTAFLGWLRGIVQRNGSWDGERVIVFTEYRDTQRWLYERLIAAGVPSEAIAQLYGGQDLDERERVKNVFQDDLTVDPVRILLATDSASEGINLQNHCHRVLHWEIPWNPNRLEQRNGRVDRHGQTASKVEIVHFVPQGWDRQREEDTGFTEGALEDAMAFLGVAVRKVEQIRTDLGSAGEVIASQVEQKMLGKRSSWQSTDREIQSRAGKAVLKIERNLAHDLQQAQDQLTRTRSELNLNPQTIEQVVRTALRLAHNKDLIDTPSPKGVAARCFRLPELKGGWAQARSDGLRHPVSGRERPVTFDQDYAGRTDVVLLHLNHRLVDLCLRLLRAELWSQGEHGARLSRVTARVVPGDLLRSPAVIAHGRVVITGNRGVRLHEQIALAGGLIEHGKLVVEKDSDVLERWLATASQDTPPSELLDRLVGLWEMLEKPLGKALATESNKIARKQSRVLDKRCEEDVKAMQAVLTELERNIRESLDSNPQWQQISLLAPDPERDQLKKDHAELEARLAAIPAQRETEAAALRHRYADPVARRFPVAVTFLVPASLITGPTAHQAGR
ncbi:helicase SNF2 family protein [Kitasatospora herbaricolor]|uniref:DISARM system SNF2-like helicase DrmD n=1 Tax=Kitasatospora herbaricolor TaxID=68217 RepID=UPI0019901E55|nr:DISARM system SNF2-like helicase DrmD [Kitasatospora herbaricolor]MDQ0313335.1 superfamily II DNA/RNA helicase [Kitasatospora herbaricolor]GGV41964.1 helicase SNF2 family protein [Kitasatospora herbaricolor]